MSAARLLCVEVAATTLLLWLSCGAGHAQSYPAKPIRVVVSTGAGGSADTLTRLFAQKLTERLRQQVIVENRGGAAGVIATEAVAKAAPDGYTLLSAYGSHVVNPALYPKLPYDTIRDFAPITQIAQQPLIVVAHPSLPAKSAKDLIALARARPGEILHVSAGSGSGGHVAAEMFASMAHIKMTHVPFKSASAALASVAGGHTHLMFAGIVNAIPQVRSGRLRAIGVTSSKRSRAVPDVPTLAEAAVTGYDVVVGYFLLAPAATPKAVIDRLNTEAMDVLSSADLVARYEQDGAEPVPRSSGDTAAYIAAEIERFGKVVKAARVQAD